MKRLIIMILLLNSCIKSFNSLNIISKKNINEELRNASRDGNLKQVINLLSKGANVNDNDNNGSTALMHASSKGFVELVELLLNNGANINDKDNGYTALIYASYNGHKKIVELLLNNGANVNDETNSGYTALIYASYHGHKEVVELLIKAGANVNYKNIYGRTALIFVSNKLKGKSICKEEENKYIDIAYILVKEMKYQLETLNIYSIPTSYDEKATKRSKNICTNEELNKYLKESIELFDFLLSYKNESLPLYKKLPKELFIHIIKFIN